MNSTISEGTPTKEYCQATNQKKSFQNVAPLFLNKLRVIVSIHSQMQQFSFYFTDFLNRSTETNRKKAGAKPAFLFSIYFSATSIEQILYLPLVLKPQKLQPRPRLPDAIRFLRPRLYHKSATKRWMPPI